MERVRLKEKRATPKRATILTDEVRDKFAELMEQGLPPDGICDYLSIAPTTFWTWMRKGERYLAGDGQPAEHEVYGAFVLAIRKAAAKYRLDLLRQAHTKGNRDWVRCVTLLERRDRKNFGRNDPLGGGEDQIDPDERFL